MVQVLQADNVTGPVAYHAEGPVWSDAWGGLRWVDMLAGALLTWRDGQVDRVSVGSSIAAFVRPRSGGGYVVATERGIALAEGPDAEPSRRITLWEDPGVRMNEGATTPDGRLLAGSCAYDAAPGRGSVYLVEPDLAVGVALASVSVSNGIGFSPDGSLAYYVDTLTGEISVFDYDDGCLRNRRSFVAIGRDTGMPDGLTVSADGTVWVALWGGGKVHGYAPSGDLTVVVELPVEQVSACTFGGPGLQTLYITTSRQNLQPTEEPEAGSVFAVRPGSTGLPVVPFRG